MNIFIRVCCSCIEKGKVLEEATFGCKDERTELTCLKHCTTKEGCELISIHTLQTHGLCVECYETILRKMRIKRRH